jgi:acyl-CoA thioesterase-1
MSLSIQNGQKIVFIGDSITDCGRRGAHQPLGHGYVRFFHDLAIIRGPEKQFQILNKGISGEKITQLRDRWTDDVIREKPDFLSIKIGINDLHSYLMKHENAVSPALYEEAYEAVLARTRSELPACQLLLIEPFYLSIEPVSEVLLRGQIIKILPEYSSIVARLAKKYGARLIESQKLFTPVLAHHSSEVLAPEPVHPHQTGHLLLAEAVYKILSE